MKDRVGFPPPQDIANSMVKDYSFRSPSGSSGIFYIGGFYDAPAAHVVLTIGGTVTQVFGGANHAHGAHAFIVASGAGGTDLVLTVTGTSITDLGARTAADSEVIVPDADVASANQYFETAKKWIGQITYTLTGSAGAFTFNYGLAKYEDFGNRNFRLTDIEAVGRAGANDSSFNVGVIYHKSTGWTYHASAFVPGTGFLNDMNTDYSTESDIAGGEYFAWKRDQLVTDVSGEGKEGLIVKIVTGSNNSVESMTVHLIALF